MSANRPLLTRGRSLVFLFAGALLVAFIAGWIRAHVVSFFGEGLLLSLPWIWLRRLGLGVLVDLPLGFSTILVGGLGGRLLVVKPWRAALSLTASVWLLDLVAAWLVTHDFLLWTDPVVLPARLIVATATAFGVAIALGWRPRRKRPNDRPPNTLKKTRSDG